jgi:predicted NAD/FAD-binding protein
MVKDVLVVGGGISGITVAYVLSKAYNVTLAEKNDYLGGHTNTRIVNDPQVGELPIDTGFIVCNSRNYPNFYNFLDQLGVSRQPSDMSFGFYCPLNHFCYLGPAWTDFIKVPQNLLKKDFIKLFFEQRKFNKRAMEDLSRGLLKQKPLRDYVQSLGLSDFFVQHYLSPLIASIWSSPAGITSEFPALTFIEFFNNHGMLQLSNRPQWETIKGGSITYINEFIRRFRGKIFISRGIEEIQRLDDKIKCRWSDGAEQIFDSVVMATHADEALKILADPVDSEVNILGVWQYSRNEAILHSDASILPPNKRYWASWNYTRSDCGEMVRPVQITYYMNRLQRLKVKKDYFVSLNSVVRPETIHYRVNYSHPVYGSQTPDHQSALRAFSGTNNTYYCGAYLYNGFHEDGVTSALDVAAAFGLSL